MDEIDVKRPMPPVPASNTFHVEQGGTAIGANFGTVNNYSGVNPEILERLYGSLATIANAVTNCGEKPLPADDWEKLSHERFCLFVIENEEYNTGSFCIPLKKALMYTDDFTKTALINLRDNDKVEIKKMPCIFAMKNRAFKRTDDGFPFMVGKINEIEIQDDNIKFSFSTFQPAFEQNILNRNTRALGLVEKTYRNQLDDLHWSIINRDLIKIGREIGIVVM